MMGNAVLTRRTVIADDFDDYMRRAQITGGASIQNPSLGVMQVYSPGVDDKAYLALNFFLPRGAFVVVKCEAKQDDANNGGRIGVDQRADDTAVGGTNVDYIQMDTQTWKPYEMIVPGDPKNPYTTVTFGQWKTGVGRASFRNMVIEIYNAVAQQPQIRGGTIRKNGDLWYIYDNVGGFASFGLKTAITVYSDRIRINFIEMQSWMRPMAFASLHHYGYGKNYDCKIGNADKTGMDIYFYFHGSSGDVSPINPNTMGDIFVDIMAVTF